MHSALRLRPPGEAVCRIVIHLSSLIFLITLSFPQSWSITITARSVEEWPGLLKWAATGLSMFLRFMSERWLFSLSFSACSVSPTYCRPHRLHWIRYTTSFDLQVAAVRRVYVLPVQWLVNMSVVIRAGQILHCDLPQGVLPGGWFARGARSARTSRSRKFFGRRYAMVEVWGKAVRFSLTGGGCGGVAE